MAIHLRLKELRQQAGSAQSELARLLDVSREAYSMYESGKRQPRLEMLDTLASHYRVSVDYLLGRTEHPAPAEPLTDGERALLARYRALDERGQRAVGGLAELETILLAQKGPE